MASAPVRPMSDSLVPILWRQHWIVLGIVAATGVLGLLYLTKITPIYKSTSRIYVEQSGPRIIHDTQEGVMTGSMNYLYTQAELMRAAPVVSAALETCGSKHLEAFAHIDSPLEFLKKNLEVSVGRKDDIISVSFGSPYSAENAEIVNAVVDAYVAFHATRMRRTSAEVLKILQKEKAARDQALSEHVRALVQYREDHPTLAFQTELGNTILERYERLSSALTEAQLATLEAKSYYDTAVQMADDPATLMPFVEAHTAAMPSAETTALKARLRELQTDRSDRLMLVTAEHPGIRGLDSEIAQIERDIAHLDRQSVVSRLAVLRQRYLTAQAREQQLSAQLDEQRRQVAGLNQAKAQYTLLETEYEQLKKLSDAMEDRIREVNVTEDAGALNITVLETARPARLPSEPKKARVLAMFLVLGLMLGGAAALLLERTNHSLRTADEVMPLLSSPLLGEVPVMSKRRTPSEDHAPQTALDPSSAVAEAFRNIRTAVFFSLPHEQSRIIQVTSAMPGEGKSTVVSHLGIAMARSGQTVLIVDANFRKPSQHLTFGVTGEKGLSSVLTRKERLGQAIVGTSTPGLHLLPAGHEVSDPAELLESKVLGAVLVTLSRHYDRILVDTPPLGPTADARIVAAQCQATILVVRPGVCTHPALSHAQDVLHHSAGHLLGAVVNGIRGGTGWDRLPRRISDLQGHRTGGNGKQKIRQHAAAISPGRTAGSLSEPSRTCTGARPPLGKVVSLASGYPVPVPTT